jgi:hypothetical protein
MAIKRNPIIEKVRHPYFLIRNNPFIYKNIVNRKYRPPSFDLKYEPVQQKIIDDLHLNGIAMVHFSELFPIKEFSKLLDWIYKNEGNLKQKNKKKYLYTYYGTEDESKPIDLDNPFVQFFLSEKLLQVAVSYLGYIPQLYEIFIEKTVPVGDASPTYSQNWHRDPEEKKTLKIFLYLNDVNIESGPFTYILRSQPTAKSKLAKLFPQKLPHGSYPDSESIKKSVPDGSYYVATAEKATLIFCDTAGIHKGGHAIKNDRIMATAFFPSRKYSIKPLFKLDNLKNSSHEKHSLSFLGQKVLGIK